ncbi:MAG: DUF4236 domain-containing protein [Balneolaceae bacterium]|nr:DUF4236 domain-containing protein [Balneolaceae bacterium]
MAFFIRKAFRSGPLRLNLSKGGLGLSVGITGARLGVNRRGTYVYGGRHGLYYRKQLGSKSRKKGSSNQTGHKGGTRRGETVDLFTDTGTTFQPVFKGFKAYPLPDLQREKDWFLNPIIILILLALAAFGVIQNSIALWAIMMILLALLTVFWIRNYIWEKRGKSLVEHTTKVFERSPESVDHTEILAFSAKAPKTHKAHYLGDLYTLLLQIALEQPDDVHIRVFNTLEKQIPLSNAIKNKIKRAFLSQALDNVLEDHLLSEEEENQMRNLVQKLNLPEDFAREELNYLAIGAEIRREIESPLSEIEAPIPLVRGERCFAVFDDARLLEERVLNRFQRNLVQYRELGFEIQLSGTLTVTDRRIVLTGRGSREYRLNRIADIITDLEANVIELILTNRKNPVFITHSKILLLASRIEKVRSAFI